MVAIDQSSHILVFARGDDNDSCARPTVGDNGDVLSIGITTHTLLKILSAVFLGLTLLNSIIHITRHLARYTAPSQQRQIIRIILVPTVFAIFSFLSVFFYQTSIYLRPLAEIYESIAIPAIFILYVHYVFPGSHSWRELFYRLEDPHSRESGIAGGDVTWFKRTCVLVFQYPIAKTASSIVEIATQGAGVYCVNSLAPRHAHLWCEIINILAILLAVPHVIRFERRMKEHIDPKHKPGAKLWTFKGFVFLQFLQLILFGLLNGRLSHPTASITFNDLYYGIPATLTCIEAWIFTIIFMWSFSTKEYAPDNIDGQCYRMPFWRALLDSLNIADLVEAIAVLVRILMEGNWQPIREDQNNGERK
ncbi:organic solute transporter Ostalpha domain-containing protein [Trichoderma sp. SZMC 28013]